MDDGSAAKPERHRWLRPFKRLSDLNNFSWAVINGVAAVVTIGLFIFGPFEQVLGAFWSTVVVLVLFGLMVLVAAFGVRSSSQRFASRLLERVGADQQTALNQLQQEYFSNSAKLTAEMANLVRLRDSLAHFRSHAYRLRLVGAGLESAGSTDAEARQGVFDLLGELASTFEALSGSACRVCIKLVYIPAGHSDPAVYTFARSNRASPDEAGIGPHWVNLNTDFRNIWIGAEDSFFSGNIHALAEKDYLNTSPSRPYTSVIVWPLRAFGARSPTQVGGAKVSIIGYLCLDSKAKKAFGRDRELLVGWWVVDVLAPVLERLMEANVISSEPNLI